ncbi:MAG: hypothetical protein JO147_08905 [Actinobacteria bacterium]|nr:hypothetical protein [Actinomycetota bacterium]
MFGARLGATAVIAAALSLLVAGGPAPADASTRSQRPPAPKPSAGVLEVRAGGALALSVAGFAPGTSVTARLECVATTTTSADAQGRVHVHLVVMPSALSGRYVLTVVGAPPLRNSGPRAGVDGATVQAVVPLVRRASVTVHGAPDGTVHC